MSKESINLLKIQLYLEYYKKDITDRYIRSINKIVLDNDVLNNLDERMYITTLDAYNELKLVKEENKQLNEKFLKQTTETYLRQTRIDKAIKYIEHNSPNLSNSEIYELLEILKGDNNGN